MRDHGTVTNLPAKRLKSRGFLPVTHSIRKLQEAKKSLLARSNRRPSPVFGRRGLPTGRAPNPDRRDAGRNATGPRRNRRSPDLRNALRRLAALGDYQALNGERA
jgi:hypothetical protein